MFASVIGGGGGVNSLGGLVIKNFTVCHLVLPHQKAFWTNISPGLIIAILRFDLRCGSVIRQFYGIRHYKNIVIQHCKTYIFILTAIRFVCRTNIQIFLYSYIILPRKMH